MPSKRIRKAALKFKREQWKKTAPTHGWMRDLERELRCKCNVKGVSECPYHEELKRRKHR